MLANPVFRHIDTLAWVKILCLLRSQLRMTMKASVDFKRRNAIISAGQAWTFPAATTKQKAKAFGCFETFLLSGNQETPRAPKTDAFAQRDKNFLETALSSDESGCTFWWDAASPLLHLNGLMRKMRFLHVNNGQLEQQKPLPAWTNDWLNTQLLKRTASCEAVNTPSETYAWPGSDLHC